MGMSEYQYYEFQAIDRPLTEKEMDELRSYSTRARITPTNFVNEYSWGDFKGNADKWMERYFDAFLYVANWGTHMFKLRLPAKLLPTATARQYCVGNTACAKEKDGKVIVSLTSENEEGGVWDEGENWLSSLIPIRAELARGDLRALYLGWLLCAQNSELDENVPEPPVPPNLTALSASLQSLVDFLRISEDLLAVAAESSAKIQNGPVDRKKISAWVNRLPVTAKDEILVRLVIDGEAQIQNELLRRFEHDRKKNLTDSLETRSPRRRSVAELLAAAEKRTEARLRAEAERATETKQLPAKSR